MMTYVNLHIVLAGITVWCVWCIQVMQVLQELIPKAVRPYSLLHSYTSDRRQMVTSLVFTDAETLVSGSRDCHVRHKIAV